jgi:hypothetical protein
MPPVLASLPGRPTAALDRRPPARNLGAQRADGRPSARSTSRSGDPWRIFFGAPSRIPSAARDRQKPGLPPGKMALSVKALLTPTTPSGMPICVPHPFERAVIMASSSECMFCAMISSSYVWLFAAGTVVTISVLAYCGRLRAVADVMFCSAICASGGSATVRKRSAGLGQEPICSRITHRHFAIRRSRWKPNSSKRSVGPVWK